MTDSHDPLQASRLRAHEELLSSYPHRFERTHLAAELHEAHAGLEPGSATDLEVSVAGRVMLHRSFGRLQFATLKDGSGTIQLFVDQEAVGADDFARFESLHLGDWLGATGTIMATKRGELSVRLGGFTILQKSLRPLPDKWHGLTDVEARSRHRYVDLMVNEESLRVAIARTEVVAELRRILRKKGFIEVETPVLLVEATGAMAKPFRTHHNALDLDLAMRIATELHLKRLVVGGLERVFELGRIFRNEGIDATHNPEFTMLEAYQALADYQDMMGLIEELFTGVTATVRGSTTIEYQGRALDMSAPFRRASMIDLVSEATGQPVDLDAPLSDLSALAEGHQIDVDESWGPGRLMFELYERLVEPTIWDPTFVLDYPVEVSPLARRRDDDPRLTERFEIVIAGSEYANAFSELTDPIDQRQRFQEQAAARAAGDEEAHPLDEDYLEALEYGLPPTGGLGIGVDRLVMLLTDSHHIREVILFPLLRPQERGRT